MGEMTQPLEICHPDPHTGLDSNIYVQNITKNSIKCIKCDRHFVKEALPGHLKEHIQQKMGRKETDLVRGTKTVVKLETMNIPIKRKRHGSSGSSNKRIKLLDGETELSVDPTVDKVLCRSCKPAKYFKDVDALRYHLVCSHDVPKSSSYYCDPSLSPKPKLQTPVNCDLRKVRVKSQSVISEIQDVAETPESPAAPAELETVDHVGQVKNNSESSLAGKFREALRVRRMNAKRSALNGRSTKPQPACLSEKKLVSDPSDAMKEDIKQEVISDEPEIKTKVDTAPPLEETSSSKRQSRRLSQQTLPEKDDDIQSAKLGPREEASSPTISKDKFLAPAPVKKVSRFKSSKKTPEVKVVETTGRRVSERRFEGKKPYKCNHCQLSYSSLENKKVHEQTHIEKNLICVFCDMRFYFPLCLKKHKRIHQN